MVSQKIKQYLIEPAIVGASVIVGTALLTPMVGFIPTVVELATLSLRTLVTATVSAIAGSMIANAVSKKI